jgi:hypothetical protein
LLITIALAFAAVALSERLARSRAKV